MTGKDKARKARAAREAPRRAETVVPPEGVPIRLELADLGSRFGAQVLDILITGGTLVCFIFILVLAGADFGNALQAFVAISFFLIRTPYYVLAELAWNGQTLGKRICGIRVVSRAGRSLTPHQIVARNLMREMEVFVPGTMLLGMSSPGIWEALLLLGWIGGLVAVPLLNRRRQRLGDLVADTMVIRRPEILLLPDLSTGVTARREAERERFVFQPFQLDLYGAYELQVLEGVLQAEQAGAPEGAQRRAANLRAIGERIRARIEYSERVAEVEEVAFLTAFYTAQRAYLEKKKLFGEERADKFHREETGR